MTPRLPLLLLIALSVSAASARGADDGNLIEYSYGGFAEGSVIAGPMLLPPMVKIYRDGRIVFFDDRSVWQGRVPQKRLSRLAARLAANPLLRDTRIVPVKKGAPAGLHGGMAYIRYLDGDREVVIGALVVPRGGAWNRLLKRIRDEIPSTYSSFIPETISVRVLTRGSWAQPVPWPFSSTTPLRSPAVSPGTLVSVSDSSAVAFVLKHASGGFSWLETVVSEGGQAFSLHLSEVPGWYEPRHLETLLGALAYDFETQEGSHSAP